MDSLGVMMLAYCNALEQVAFPAAIKRIPNSVCYGCSMLTTVKIGSKVTTIGGTAFSLCLGLKKIESNAVKPPKVLNNAFSGIVLGQTELLVPVGTKAAYQQAEVWNTFNPITEMSDAAASFTTELVTGSEIYVGVKSSEKFAIKFGDGVKVDYEAGDYSALGKRIKGIVKGSKIELCGNANAISDINLAQQKVTQIDLGQLRNLVSLVLSENLLDTLDMTKFAYLKKLHADHNKLKSIDLKENKMLEEVRLSYNQINSTALPDNAALKKVVISNNPIATLDMSRLPNLTAFEADSCQFATIDILGNTKLEELDMDANALTAINFGNHSALWWVYLGSNQLRTIDVTGLTALSNFNVADNQLTAINVTKNASLRELYLSGNNIGNVDLTQNNSMMRLYVNNCGMTELNTKPFDRLSTLEAKNNNLTTIDLAANIRLKNLSVSHNMLTQLSLSKNTKLERLEADNNILETVTLDVGNKFVKCLLHNNNLTTATIDGIFAKLPDVSAITTDPDVSYHKTITVYANPGSADCNDMLATNKGWKVEKGTRSGITMPKQDNGLMVTTAGNTILVNGVTAGDNYALFDLNGRMVDNGTATTSSLSINITKLHHGCYILKVGNNSIKIMH